MKVDELRVALEDLAGPIAPADGAALRSVRRHAWLARTWRVGVGAVAAVAVVVGAAVLTTGSNDPSVATAPPSASACSRLPKAVPASRVPADVAAWAGGPVPTSTKVVQSTPSLAVIGSGGIWTIRAALSAPANFEQGTWNLKFPWFTRPSGTPTITGRRLDGPGTFSADANVAQDATSTFVTSTMRFSQAGCWKVTARYGDSKLSFPIRIGGG